MKTKEEILKEVLNYYEDKTGTFDIESTTKRMMRKAISLAFKEKDKELKKKVDEVFQGIELTIKLYPHKHGDELSAEIIEHLKTKIFNFEKRGKEKKEDLKGDYYEI